MAVICHAPNIVGDIVGDIRNFTRLTIIRLEETSEPPNLRTSEPPNPRTSEPPNLNALSESIAAYSFHADFSMQSLSIAVVFRIVDTDDRKGNLYDLSRAACQLHLVAGIGVPLIVRMHKSGVLDRTTPDYTASCWMLMLVLQRCALMHSDAFTCMKCNISVGCLRHFHVQLHLAQERNRCAPARCTSADP